MPARKGVGGRDSPSAHKNTCVYLLIASGIGRLVVVSGAPKNTAWRGNDRLWSPLAYGATGQ